jgi:hypothetical protein
MCTFKEAHGRVVREVGQFAYVQIKITAKYRISIYINIKDKFLITRRVVDTFTALCFYVQFYHAL